MHLSEFLNMGGYACYVWPAYGIAGFVFLTNIVLSIVESKNIRAQIKDIYKTNDES